MNSSNGPPAQQGPRPAIVHLRAPKLDLLSQVSGSQGFYGLITVVPTAVWPDDVVTVTFTVNGPLGCEYVCVT
jgi:hypothetical protein